MVRPLTPRRTLIDIQNFVDSLANAEVAISTNKVVQNWLQPSGYQKITWATNATTEEYLFRNSSPTIEEYLGWVKNSSYSALLLDGSVLQISYDFDGLELVGHRLYFFPCPFDLDVSLVRELPFLGVVDFYAESLAFERIRLRTPIRFDYQHDATIGGVHHPRSHMTFQWSYVRVPVTSPLSLGQFIRFVFKNFYPLLWNVHRFIREWPIQILEHSIEYEELSEIHLAASH